MQPLLWSSREARAAKEDIEKECQAELAQGCSVKVLPQQDDLANPPQPSSEIRSFPAILSLFSPFDIFFDADGFQSFPSTVLTALITKILSICVQFIFAMIKLIFVKQVVYGQCKVN